MNVSCPSCQTKYSVDDSRVPPSGVSIKCPKCSHTFVAKKEEAVPLPGNPGAVPLPGRKSSAVALPGNVAPPSASMPDSDDLSLDDDLDLGLDDDLDLPGPAGLDLPGISADLAPAQPKGQSLQESGVLDFIDDTHDRAGAGGGGGIAENEFKVRRRNGRVEGPYGLGRLIALLRNNELQGNEDISEDGVQWRAMTSHPELNQAINQLAGSDDLDFGMSGGSDFSLGLDADPPPAHNAPPPPRANSLDDIMDNLDLDEAAAAASDPRAGQAMEDELNVPPIGGEAQEGRRRRGEDDLEVGDIPELPPIWQTYRKPILIFLGVIITILVGVFTQLFTPYGAFGIKGLISALTTEAPPPEPVKPPPPPAKVADPKEIASLIDEHSYEGFRSVFATIQQAGPNLPDNMLAEAKARGFATLSYGTDHFPLPELEKSVAALNTVDLAKAMGGNAAAANVEILKARSALEIMKGQAETAAAQLAGQLEQRSDDKEIALLLGLARFKVRDVKGALEAFDKAIVASPTYAPALHAIGDVVAISESPTAADDAAVWYMKALTSQPAHARSGVMAAAIFKALHRHGERRRTLALAASKAERGLPPSDRPKFLYETAQAFDDAGLLGEPAAVTAALEASRLDPANAKYVAMAAAALALSGKVDAGLTKANTLAQRAPNDPDLMIARARVLFLKDDVAKAFIDLESAKKNAARDHRIFLWEARFNIRLGKLNDARTALSKATRLTKSDPMPFVEVSRIDLQVGDVDAAFENAKKAVEMAPNDPRAKVLLGDCFARREQLEDALDTYKNATNLDDESIAAQIGYANALRNMSRREKVPSKSKKLAESIPVYLSALKQAPKNPAVLFEYGRALELQGDLSAALALYRDAASFDEKDVRPHLKIVAAYLEAEPPDVKAAGSSLKRAQKIELQSGRRNAEVRFWEARHALLDKRASDAVQSMRGAVEIEPRNARYHFWMGKTLEAANSLYEAITAYEKAISLNSRHAEAHRALGWTSLERHQFDKARKSFDEYRKSRPEDKTIWVDIGVSWERQNKDGPATEAFAKAIKFNPKNAVALIKLGNIKSREGKDKDAVKFYQRAVKADRARGEAWCQLGIAKSRGKLTSEARKALKKCVEMENSPADMKQTATGILETAG